VRKALGRLLGCVLLAAAVAGVDTLAAEPPTLPIRIGVSGPFTGGSSPMGLAMRNGIRLAAA
jgi:branched-chain amino acid transport system substrate-binding protein